MGEKQISTLLCPPPHPIQDRLTFYVLHLFFKLFYQLLHVQHSCSSTQSWGSVLPSIVEQETRIPGGCPLLFSNRNLGYFCALGTEILYTHSLWEVVDHSRSKMHEICLIIIHELKGGNLSLKGVFCVKLRD